MATKIKLEPVSDEDPCPTSETSQVSVQADNESRLQYMMENRKKANVYQVKTKEELFGARPSKSGSPVIATAKLPGTKRAHIVDAGKVPTRMPARKRKRDPEPQPEQEPIILIEEEHTQIDMQKLLIGIGCVCGGLYLLKKSRDMALVEEIGSSIEA